MPRFHRSRLPQFALIFIMPIFMLACILSATPNDVARLRGRSYRACATSTPLPTPPPPPPQPAQFTPIGQAGWSVSANSFQSGTGNEPSQAIDGDPSTFWHTEFFSPSPPAHPHYLEIDLGGSYTMTMLAYTPKQLDPNGRISSYSFAVSNDGASWNTITSGNFVDGTQTQYAQFSEVTASHIRLTAHSEVNGGPWASVGEFNVGYGTAATSPSAVAAVPTETPYYQVGRHYLYQTALIDGIGIKLADYQHELHPEPARGRMHYFTFEVTNFNSDPLIVPLTQLVFVSEVKGIAGDLVRGQWNNKADVLDIGGYPNVYELDDTPIAPDDTRSITLGLLTPEGTVGEVGIITDWDRPVEFGAPIWFILEEDLTPCEHGEVVDPPTPTKPFASLITPLPPPIGGPITTTTGSGIAIPPTTGYTTSGFGCRLTITGLLDPILCEPGEEFHDGIDIANVKNHPIVAPITGTVIFAGAQISGHDCSFLDDYGSDPPHIGYGNYIVVDGPAYNQRHTMAHLSSFVASVGDTVNQGDVIGYMGSTGCSTAPHTHWSCRIGGAIVDPSTC